MNGKPTFIKSEFYEVFGAGFDSNCIGSERDPQVHSRMKRNLLGAFSIKSLREQEDTIQNCIDRFLLVVGVEGNKERGIDMTKWFEMIAFDVLGEMAFGESFDCIEQGLLPRQGYGGLLICMVVLRSASCVATNGSEASILHYSHRQSS